MFETVQSIDLFLFLEKGYINKPELNLQFGSKD